jgi:hypothetical protein
MRNTAPTRSISRRRRQWIIFAFLIAAVGVFICTISLVLSAIPLVNPTSTAYGGYTLVLVAIAVVGGVLLLIAAGVGIRGLTWRAENDLAQATARVLAASLDDRYTLVRNVNRRETGYIDAVLVGTAGALVFRILDKPGDYVNDGANWLQRKRSGGIDSAGINPTREAITDIRRLREFLGKNGLGDVPVYGVVVFTIEPPRIRIEAQNPTVPPTVLSALLPTLRANYLASETRIDGTRVDRVVRLLLGD